jgi:tetratricopeptide (TPR) repeat protein
MNGVLLVALLGAATSGGNGSHFDEAVRAYERFEYESALAQLELALAATPDSDHEAARIHLYIGLVHFTLGHRQRADDAFIAALRLWPDAALPEDTSPKVLARLRELKSRPPPLVAAAPDEPAVATTPEPAAPKAAERSLFWTWVVAGAGGATLATGGVFGLLANAAHAEARDATFADDTAAANERADSRRQVATTLFIGGGVLLAAAVGVFFLESSAGPSVATDGDGVVVSLGGTF